jgi:mannan endo-1,6-alpha-mannosidase
MGQTNGEEKWRVRTQGLVDATIRIFFPDNIAYEIACEEHMSCTTDMLSFKGYLHRWMAVTTQIAPFTAAKILPVLRTSAEAAVATCTGEANGRACGFKWNTKAYDGSHGAGQQMNVLGAVSSLLIEQARVPLTNSTGGTSRGDPNAGSHSDTFDGKLIPPTTADKAGAGIITVIILGAAVGTFGWMGTGI